MVVCGSKAPVEFNGAQKVRDRLLTLVQNSEQKSNVVFDIRRIRRDCCSFLPEGERALSISLFFKNQGAGLELFECLLCVQESWKHWRKEDEQNGQQRFETAHTE